MTSRDIVRYRTVNQRIAATQSPKPEDAVFALGAVQAQDYKGALWAVGLRTRGAKEETVERAIADRTIVRTWPMRGTLHFVVPRDVRWMLKYLAPRMIARGALRRRQLHIDDETLRRSRIVLVRALRDGKRLTREAAFGLLEKHSIPCGSQRGIHIVWQLAQEGYICFGPRQGKQPTVVLLDDWVPMTNIPYRDEALGTLALRYFTGHGPATLKDFAWWSGLPASDARDALESIKSKLNGFISGKATYWMHEGHLTKGGIFPKVVLLPPFDEYLVGYNDRSASVGTHHARRVHPGGGILHPTIFYDGKIIGTWGRAITKESVDVHSSLFGKLPKSHRKLFDAAVERYGGFIGKTLLRR